MLNHYNSQLPFLNRVEALCDPGSVKFQEDLVILNKPCGIIGVVDGVSEPYRPALGPLLFEGQTGGQIAARTVSEVIAAVRQGESLAETILRANDELNTRIAQIAHEYCHEISRHGVDFDSGADRPGVTGAFARFLPGSDLIELITWGDSFAVWRYKDGSYGASSNQLFNHDWEMRERIALLMEQFAGDRDKMWTEFTPFLKSARNARVNNIAAPAGYGYGLLNGQAGFPGLLEQRSLSCSNIAEMVLFTDGLVAYADTKDTLALAKHVIDVFSSDGLQAVLRQTRGQETTDRDRSHVDYAEASGVGVRLIAC